MAFELRDGQGSLGKNRYPKGENPADITGKCKINGQLYWINGWKRDGANGEWHSLSIRAVDEHAQVGPSGEGQSDDPGF